MNAYGCCSAQLAIQGESLTITKRSPVSFTFIVEVIPVYYDKGYLNTTIQLSEAGHPPLSVFLGDDVAAVRHYSFPNKRQNDCMVPKNSAPPQVRDFLMSMATINNEASNIVLVMLIGLLSIMNHSTLQDYPWTCIHQMGRSFTSWDDHSPATRYLEQLCLLLPLVEILQHLT